MSVTKHPNGGCERGLLRKLISNEAPLVAMRRTYPTTEQAKNIQFAVRRAGFDASVRGSILTVNAPEKGLSFLENFGGFTTA
jgi:hypothetical protein